MKVIARTLRAALGVALTACVGCGPGGGGGGGDAGAEDAGPAFQRVEIVLQSWSLTNAGLKVEPPGDLELQIGWILAYPQRPTPDDRAEIATHIDLLQKGDIRGDDHIWAMNETLAVFDHYCADPDPSIVLTLLEVDEGFGDSGTKTRSALAAAATGLGIFFPATGVVLGAGLILEGLFAKNDDLGQGEFNLDPGSNRLSLSGRDTRSIVTVVVNVLDGSCP
ncbi:MAG: hypothetical protein KC583_02115 [Myxococcales bacterium]|nr:hypothetical protein [Myxococcales bacterium]